ncbi:MAG: hypothetical protein PVJ57_13240 [Phycisphaerae bacterium]|jgi:hypothetical protein
MLKITWADIAGEDESLARCLGVVLEAAGGRRPYDELVSLLGLGAATVAVEGMNPSWWPTCGRDVALDSTAVLLGMRVRELHPPAAAVGLERSSEYAAHFRDSYAPLVRVALANDQPVLAWCGWPAPAERCWGVIVRAREEALIGYVGGHDGQPVELVGPALQAHVIEDCHPTAATAEQHPALFEHAVRVAEMWYRGGMREGAVRTGAAAWALWGEVVAQQVVPAEWHLPAIRAVVDGRRCLAAWLEHIAGDLNAGQRAIADEWLDTCAEVAALLAPLVLRPEEATLAKAIAAAGRREAALLPRLAKVGHT